MNRPCLERGCPTLSPRPRCLLHTRQHERTRRPHWRQRYGPDYVANRELVLDRDGYLCRVGLSGCTRLATTVDHVVPRSLHGSDETDNLVASCAYCNYAKRDGRGAPGSRKSV